MNKQTVYSMDEDWTPGHTVHYPMITLCGDCVEIVPGELALSPCDLRALASMCLEAADDLEASS